MYLKIWLGIIFGQGVLNGRTRYCFEHNLGIQDIYCILGQAPRPNAHPRACINEMVPAVDYIHMFAAVTDLSIVKFIPTLAAT